MEFFPIFLRLSGREVLVVGGGEIAARKVRLLLKGRASIRVLAPELCAELQLREQKGEIQWQAERFDPTRLGQPVLVIAASNDAEVNRQVASVARHRHVPANVVDELASSTAIMPSIVDRSPLVVALSSGGTAPVLARRLRAQIEVMLPAGYGRLASLAGSLRQSVKERLPEPGRRLRFWESIFDGAVAERAVAGEPDQARRLLNRKLDAAAEDEMPAGEVFLVGVGPGDPDLLTLRAFRLMQLADVVLYDRLIPESIMELVRRDAERIDVGKRESNHTLPQEDINALLVRLASEGHRVLRLKGGDPFMFGRGGEEIQELMAAGIPFQVVPGITAALGCAAYAGIPLTHRDHAQSCIFVTGHARADGKLALDWQSLAQANQTVVIYMGTKTLATTCAALRKAGLPDDWPAALIFNGTRPEQINVVGTISDLPERLGMLAVEGPGLLIVGQVVSLQQRLNWRNTAVVQ